jgi:hypothetical protein
MAPGTISASHTSGSSRCNACTRADLDRDRWYSLIPDLRWNALNAAPTPAHPAGQGGRIFPPTIAIPVNLGMGYYDLRGILIHPYPPGGIQTPIEVRRDLKRGHGPCGGNGGAGAGAGGAQRKKCTFSNSPLLSDNEI